MRLKSVGSIVAWLAGLPVLLSSSALLAAPPWNMPKGVTEISHEVYNLHMTIFGICAAIGVLVFGAMFIAIIRHRKSRGHKAAQFHESTTVEILWTVIPFIILIVMAIPATKTLIAMEDTTDADMTIKATGYQWLWKYDYMDNGISFFSALATPRKEIYNQQQKDQNYLLKVNHQLVVPIHKKIRILLTSNDVIHAWWVPQLAIKKDAIPGYINEVWTNIDKPGIYRGQCAELCGRGHGFMPIVVRAVTQDEYQQWVKQHKATGDSKQVAEADTEN